LDTSLTRVAPSAYAKPSTTRNAGFGRDPARGGSAVAPTVR
jgi:hypothetical protein